MFSPDSVAVNPIDIPRELPNHCMKKRMLVVESLVAGGAWHGKASRWEEGAVS